MGIHVNTAYKLIRRGTFPCPVMRVGGQYRVATRALLVTLHIDEIPVQPEHVNNGAAFARHADK
ncbi:helix-turn-helix domain-containing protein, partial [Amycolatopsis sacchari]|uniref:helix-turn-helix domain-containing protein n=1 Tax=Amycolatopsis sacchari TaxID=115433 RepID=UPI003EBEC0BE